MPASARDGVRGLGPGRRTARLGQGGSLKRLRAASVEEIASVRGMGERTAQAVVAALGGGTTDDRPSQDTPAQDEAAARA